MNTYIFFKIFVHRKLNNMYHVDNIKDAVYTVVYRQYRDFVNKLRLFTSYNHVKQNDKHIYKSQ